MPINRIDLKNRARNTIRTSNKPKIITVSFAFLLLSAFIGLLSQRLIGADFTQSELQQYMQHVANGNFDYAASYLADKVPPPSSWLIDLALQIVLTVVSVGFVIFLLNSIRNTAPCFENLLDGFGMFWRIIVLNILEGIFVALWSLLLIFPGIIAAYRYSQATYLLIDHPEMTPMQCIRESKRMMMGHKWERFTLDLSFLGWALLASIPYVGYIVQVWTVPFFNTTKALYYETLRTSDPAAGNYSENFYADSNGPTPPWEG